MGAAKRRRRQLAMGNKHLARICGKHVRGGRPIYARHSKEFYAAKLAASIAKERLISNRKSQRKR